jgi:hypothetical protein
VRLTLCKGKEAQTDNNAIDPTGNKPGSLFCASFYGPVAHGWRMSNRFVLKWLIIINLGANKRIELTLSGAAHPPR